MNKTLNFARLDLITIKPYLTWKILLLFLAVCAMVGSETGETSVIVGMCMIYGVIFASYPFVIGEKSALDTLYSTLPVSKKSIVAGRYLFSVLLNLATLVMSCLISFITISILGKEFNLITNVLSALVCFVLFTLIVAIQLPIYFKFGYTKAKFLTYIPLMAFPAATLIVSTSVDKNDLMPIVTGALAWIESNILLASALIAAFWVVFMLISAILSYRVYRKREF